MMKKTLILLMSALVFIMLAPISPAHAMPASLAPSDVALPKNMASEYQSLYYALDRAHTTTYAFGTDGKNATVLAYNYKTRKVTWKKILGSKLNIAMYTQFEYDHGHLYLNYQKSVENVYNEETHLLVLSAQTGEVLNQIITKYPDISKMVFSPDGKKMAILQETNYVYVAKGGKRYDRVSAYDTTNLSLLWDSSFPQLSHNPDNLFTTPQGDNVYLDTQGYFRAYDWQSGEEIWTVNFAGEFNLSPNGVLVGVDESTGDIVRINPVDGTPMWRFHSFDGAAFLDKIIKSPNDFIYAAFVSAAQTDYYSIIDSNGHEGFRFPILIGISDVSIDATEHILSYSDGINKHQMVFKDNGDVLDNGKKIGTHTLKWNTASNSAPGTSIFWDIKGHWAESSITALANQKILAGYADGSFHPDDPISRSEFLKLLLTGLNKPFSTSVNLPFTDTPATSWYTVMLQTGLDDDIIVPGEYAGGQFKPNQSITREEMAVWMARALSLTLDAAGAQKAADAKNISNLGLVGSVMDKGYLVGFDDGTFRPSATTTRAESATLLVRVRQSLGL